jgi:hypothetical protein
LFISGGESFLPLFLKKRLNHTYCSNQEGIQQLKASQASYERISDRVYGKGGERI